MSKEKKQESEITPEQARSALQQAAQRRVAACEAEITKTLEKHRCTIAARPTFTNDGRIVAEAVVVALND